MSYIGNQPAPTNIPIANLDGVTATNTELNHVDGVTSAIQTQIDAKQPYATIAVTVVDSGGNKYALDGTVQQLGLLTPSVTYMFDQSDSSNSGHPLRLSTTSNGSHGGGSAFTTGITVVGTPGSAGAYTQVKLEQDAPDTLYYYCTNHSGMGGEIDVRATVSSLSDLSVTATASELNIMDGVTSTAAELNILDGVTSTAAELNYVDGVTSNVQTQLDAKAPLASPTFSGTVSDGDGKIRAIPQSGSDKTSNYTLTTGDIGNFIGVGSSGGITVPNSTFSAGDAVSLFNNTSGDITITLSITTAYLAGTDADKASLTLATRGVCTILFLSGTVCVVSGNVS